MARNKVCTNVLVSRFSALGDVAMTIPVVYDACTSNPGKHFFFLTRKHPAGLFINQPANLTVVPVDLDEWKGINGMRKLCRHLAKTYGIDLYIDLHDVLRTQLLRFFFRLRGVRTICFRKGRRTKSALTRRRNKVLLPLISTIDRYREAFHRAGLKRESRFSNIFENGKGDPSLFAKATPPKKPGEFWLAVAPFAKHKGKIYPLHLMKTVCDHFADDPDCRLFLLGAGESELRMLRTLAEGNPNAVIMPEHPVGMEGELALLSHCDVMLSMDSANMHMASLTGLRVVSVWGATHPFSGFMGWRQNEADAVQLDMVCRPCSVFGNKPCRRKDYFCLNGISPNLIIARIEASRTGLQDEGPHSAAVSR